MELRLYNTLSQTVQQLEPVEPGHVSIYLCGPTVQGDPHIGHLRAAVCFDVLIRWLHRCGYSTTYIRNITDIDDKILIRSDNEGIPWWKLATRYERAFDRAYRTLGLIPPDHEPHATAHIPEQIELTQRLIERGAAYADGQGNVYFDVHAEPTYGSLTHQDLADVRTTEDSGDVDAQRESGKRDPRDFALWKATKPGEPESAAWNSPWGPGRPGWHLECSAMAHKYLGETFDIHGGGIDLRFPHHENEQAQSHAAGWDFARLWVHNAWVTQAHEKMSKSLGNTLALDSLLEDYPPVVVRFALCTVHYRSMIEWDEETLPRAQAAWERISGYVQDASEVLGEQGTNSIGPEGLPPAFVDSLNDDLNVAGAMASVYEHMKLGRKALGDPEEAIRQLSLVRSMLDILGLDPVQWECEDDTNGYLTALDHLVTSVVAARNEARAEKNWAAADRLRDQLKEAGITIEDGAGRTSWRLS